MDIEAIIYKHAKDLNITLLTVSHRTSLWHYHDYILQFDGKGGYIFNKLDAAARLALEEERQKIDYTLGSVQALQERLAVLEQFTAQTSD